MTDRLLRLAALALVAALLVVTARAETARHAAEAQALAHRLTSDSLSAALHEARAAACPLTYCGDGYSPDPTCGGAYR